MSSCNTSAKPPGAGEELTQCLNLAYQAAGYSTALDALNRCLSLVETLGIPTTEYVQLHGRLQNAKRYSRQSEWGAARYELRLLLHAVAALT